MNETNEGAELLRLEQELKLQQRESSRLEECADRSIKVGNIWYRRCDIITLTIPFEPIPEARSESAMKPVLDALERLAPKQKRRRIVLEHCRGGDDLVFRDRRAVKGTSKGPRIVDAIEFEPPVDPEAPITMIPTPDLVGPLQRY